ncbi:MAG: hypothetical protein NT157_03920 [Candidatus Micrarchaeota archaeon]|nr:hypothetical protein [Candidatus Micrarchaeota archaeon]
MRGQVSVELIIVIVALLAVALVVVASLQRTSKEWSSKEETLETKLMSAVDKTAGITKLKAAGASCEKGDDCESGVCGYDGKCE